MDTSLVVVGSKWVRVKQGNTTLSGIIARYGLVYEVQEIGDRVLLSSEEKDIKEHYSIEYFLETHIPLEQYKEATGKQILFDYDAIQSLVDIGIHIPSNIYVENNFTNKPLAVVSFREGQHYVTPAQGSPQPLKLGKLIRAIKGTIKAEEIEKYVSKHKELYTIDTSKVLVSDDVSKVYEISRVGGSCMSYHGEYMDIYEDVGCSIVYILVPDSNNVGRMILGGRAILWHDVHRIDTNSNINFMDRIFFSKEVHKLTLKKWAKENGYLDIDTLKDEDAELITNATVSSNYQYVPYIDNMYYVLKHKADGTYHLANDYDYEGYWEYDHCTQTDGTSEQGSIAEHNHDNDVWCEDIDDYVSENDDYYYVEDRDCYYAHNDDLYYIDGCYYSEVPDEYVWCEDIMEYCDYDLTYYADDTGEYYYDSNNLYYIEDENIYVTDTDGYYLHSNGKWYSEPEEEEDE